MKISKNIKDRLIDALITAFVFAAALAWREAFVKVLNKYIDEEHSVWSEVVVAFFITSIVVVLVYILLKSDSIAESHFLKYKEEDTEKKKEG